MARANVTRYLALGAAGALALGLAACSGGGGGGGVDADGNATVVWSTWGTADELTRYEEFNKDFMKRHPDIKVKLQPVADYGDYHSKLLAQLTSNTAPDVFYVGDDKIGQFVDSNRLMPLSDLMDSDASQTKKDDFFPGLFGAAEKDGEVYAAPNDSNPDVFWYDKQALAAAGITEDPATLAENGEWTTDKFLEMNAQAARRRPHRHDVLELLGHALELALLAGPAGPVRRVRRLRREHGCRHRRVGAGARRPVPGRHLRGRRHAAGRRRGRQHLRDAQGGLLRAGPLHDRHGQGHGRARTATTSCAGRRLTVKPRRPVSPRQLPRDQRQDQGQGRGVHLLDRVPLAPRGRRSASRAAATRSPRSRVPTMSCSKATTRRTRRRSSTCATSASTNYPAEARVPGLPIAISEEFQKLYEGKTDAQATLDTIADVIKERSEK